VAAGPVLIGFDGTPAAAQALREAAALFAPRPAVVVVVWEAGRAFDLLEVPVLDLPAAGVDLRTAFEVDQAMYEQAQRLAQQGAALARDLGLEADGLAVADEITVADTLLRLAKEYGSQAIVVGSHGHSALGELLVGSTTRAVLKHAECPVVVVRGAR
jgi:nucleotide-binding universal stress UspA family protein